MKKLLLALGLALTVGAVNSASAESPAHTPVDVIASSSVNNSMPTIINDIAIPFNVILYAQQEYQGFTVVQASKMTRNGQQIYNLRLSQDGEGVSYDNVYLQYDMNWKLLGNEKLAAPPPRPVVQTPKQEEAEDDDDVRVEGGRGSGDGEVRTDPKPVESTAPAPGSATPAPTNPTPQPTMPPMPPMPSGQQ